MNVNEYMDGNIMVKYPRKSDVQEHKDRLWTALLQYCSGLVPLYNVTSTLRQLMGDAVLWVHNNSDVVNTETGVHSKIDLDEMKRMIGSLRVEVK